MAEMKAVQKNGKIKKVGRYSKILYGLFILAFVLLLLALGIAVKTSKSAYTESKNAAHDRVYAGFYDKAFNYAERSNHVSNRISISLGNVRETANLRVLEVTDVEYIIENEDDNDDGISAWLEVPGKGFFSVDLQTSEFLIDEERREVIVRINEPVLSDFTIDYHNVNKLDFSNSGGNDSISVGEDIARKQCREAYSELHTAFLSDPKYLDSAKRSAENIITNLIKQLNPDIPDLNVIIEYM
ncbi:DUF4230 domain-containing protein [Ruminococcus flavefaciens]|uniref:DUF4230 domain-containing protein n=1 Tax=Ruminococcus flavefaciens TaxID=1265 RepID=UPI0002E05D3D|nr:DUF4230 domain-containing protein [Ruminococcus flavefaciens]